MSDPALAKEILSQILVAARRIDLASLRAILDPERMVAAADRAPGGMSGFTHADHKH